MCTAVVPSSNSSLLYVPTRRCLGAWSTLLAVCLAPLLPALCLSSPSTQLHPLVLLPATTAAVSLPAPLPRPSAAPACLPDGSSSEQGCSPVSPHAPRLQHQEPCVSQALMLTHRAPALGRSSTPRKPLLPSPASQDVHPTMVMSCAEELRWPT